MAYEAKCRKKDWQQFLVGIRTSVSQSISQDKYEEAENMFAEQVRRGYIERIDPDDFPEGTVYYSPHRAVMKQDSQSTKVRLVYNASSKMKGHLSANDAQCAGPNLLKSFPTVLMRARERPLLLSGDVEKAFHQVKLKKDLKLVF